MVVISSLWLLFFPTGVTSHISRVVLEVCCLQHVRIYVYKLHHDETTTTQEASTSCVTALRFASCAQKVRGVSVYHRRSSVWSLWDRRFFIGDTKHVVRGLSAVRLALRTPLRSSSAARASSVRASRVLVARSLLWWRVWSSGRNLSLRPPPLDRFSRRGTPYDSDRLSRDNDRHAARW